MGKSIDWTPLIPSALQSLRASGEAVVDRSTLERLLKIHRRTAIRLLHRFGGRQAGQNLFLERERLIAALELFLPADEGALPARTPGQLRRQHREAEQFRFPDVRSLEVRSAAALPGAIQIARGRVTLEVADLRDLCAQLWVLLETCKDDWEGVERLLEGPS